MIKIISGKLGAGKTLFSVGQIFNDLCAGRTVVTNIELNYPRIYALGRISRGVCIQPNQIIILDPNVATDWDSLIPWGEVGSEVELYLDEIHLFFHARDWQKTQSTSKELISFLSQSRKACVNITFIAQEIDTIEKQFRLQSEFLYYVQSSAHIAIPLLGPFPVRFFLVNKSSTKTGKSLNVSFSYYNKRHFRLYNSLAFLDTHMQQLDRLKVRIPRTRLKRVNFLVRLYEYAMRKF